MLIKTRLLLLLCFHYRPQAHCSKLQNSKLLLLKHKRHSFFSVENFFFFVPLLIQPRSQINCKGITRFNLANFSPLLLHQMICWRMHCLILACNLRITVQEDPEQCFLENKVGFVAFTFHFRHFGQPTKYFTVLYKWRQQIY